MSALLQADMAAAAPAAWEGAVPWLVVSGVAKRFGGFSALRDIGLAVRRGEFVCLLGPSGCGKTTLLRIIAGLEAADAGEVRMAGRDVTRLPTAQRDCGIVFQSYALFPNLDVAQNIGYGLKGRAEARRARVDDLLALVGLNGQAARFPGQLSGGQQQRVALARALASSPSLLLLDEPLSALDARVRQHLRSELKHLQRTLGVTTLMVTHDQDEALTLADTVVVMDQGAIVQVDAPEALYRRPATRFVADFVGESNWLPATVDGEGGVQVAGQLLSRLPAQPAGEIDLFCRPEQLCLQARWTPGAVMAWVEQIEFRGAVRRVLLTLAHARSIALSAQVPLDDPGLPDLRPGQQVALSWPVPLVSFRAAGSPAGTPRT